MFWRSEFDDRVPLGLTIGADLWVGETSARRPAEAVRAPQHARLAGQLPPRRRRVTVGSLRAASDPKAACRAAGTAVEFIERQLGRLEERDARGRRRHRPDVDPRLWLDDYHWLAWTICGELVNVEELEPGSMRGSPEVRRLTVDELPAVYAVDRLIPTVIALYRGDRLDRGSVWRYMAHHDLRCALEAASVRARADEDRFCAVAETAPAAATKPTLPLTQPAARTQKTRHHPLGNFIVYRPPRADEDLPSYAAVLELTPVPEAFPDRRAAMRFLARMPRLGLDPNGLAVARVLGCVEVQPVWRPGIRMPREPEQVLELIRREPRVVWPELKATWLPRFVQAADGSWLLERVQKRGTVRNRWNEILLRQVADEGRRFALSLEENEIRRRAGSEEVPIDESLIATMQLVQRAERRLPGAWLEQLGMQRESLGPDWSHLAKAGEVAEAGHWLRAPCEHGRPHSDGQRRRIVELRIDDLAELFKVAGMRPRFLMVKESTSEAPKWLIPVGPTWL